MDVFKKSEIQKQLKKSKKKTYNNRINNGNKKPREIEKKIDRRYWL